MDLDAIDIYDPDAYLDGVPHESLAWLRRNAPVFFQKLPGRAGYWCLTRHADVMAASRDPATFSAARGGIVIEDQPPEVLEMMRGQLLAMDPPEHGRMRRSVLSAFTPRRVREMEPWLRERCRSIFASVGEHADFVRDLAGELPLQVICEIMGVPPGDREKIVTLADSIIGRDDPEQAAQAASKASFELGAYGFTLAQSRTDGSSPDLVSALLAAETDGHRIDEVAFAGLFVQILVAGNETTRTLLSGTLLALLERPDVYRALESQPRLLPRAIEELLRWTTPVHYFRRTATRDVTLRGQQIREGDRVVLHYTSANRDEDVFDDPFTLDIRRDPNPHLAFGFGEHFCLGASLARLEARVFLEELFAGFEKIELAAPPRRLRSNLNNAYKAMPVRLQRRRP